MNIAKIRVAEATDVQAIVQLVNQAYRPNTGAVGWTHESNWVSGGRTSVDQVMDLLLKPDSMILLKSVNSAIVACVHIEKHGSISDIGMLAVNPSQQATGIGKQMLAHAEHYARTEYGAKKFAMLVISSRIELIAFYLRRGYKKTGVLMDYPITAGVGIPKYSGMTIEVLEKPAYTIQPNAESTPHTPIYMRHQ